jgi:uncharacterized protein (TIGR02145 family)
MKKSLIVLLLLFVIVSVNAQFKDLEGKEYKTVKINNQIWISENLEVSHFRNGYKIPEVTDMVKWQKIKTPAWCYYENKTENGKVYGKLYNWYALTDPRGLVPEGWHIPTNKDFDSLLNYLGGYNAAGTKLKSINGWKSYMGTDANGNNSSGFNALPGGNNTIVGFFNLGYVGCWWSSTFIDDQRSAYYYTLMGDNNYFTMGGMNPKGGFSVRCIKD